MPNFVPITLGSPEFTSIDVDGFRITDARFPPGLVLAPHEHERASVAVMLDGAFDLKIHRGTYACMRTAAFTEPAGERHANRIQAQGAHVLVVQPDPACGEKLRPYGAFTDTVQHYATSAAIQPARRLSWELQHRDAVTPLAAAALVYELLALLARQGSRSRRSHPPPWLLHVEELLRARFRRPPGLSELAGGAGVHPAHLMRFFRLHFGMSLGAYVRQLRLEWAAHQLVETRSPLAQIAVEAGFADQSHFTRLFRAHTGLTPARYRRSHGSP